MAITANGYAALALLDRLGEGSSYDLEISARGSIGEFWPLSHTTAYEEPLRLEEYGYLCSRQEAGAAAGHFR